MNRDMRGTKILWWLCAWLAAVTPLRGQTGGGVRVRLHPEVTENRIDEKIYGFLLKHIYRSVSNGTWGETVWNRSLEQLRAEGPWQVDSRGEVLLDAMEEGQTYLSSASAGSRTASCRCGSGARGEMAPCWWDCVTRTASGC